MDKVYCVWDEVRYEGKRLLGLVYTPMNRHDLNLAKRRNHLANREFARRAHTITSKKKANNKRACRGWRYDG